MFFGGEEMAKETRKLDKFSSSTKKCLPLRLFKKILQKALRRIYISSVKVIIKIILLIVHHQYLAPTLEPKQH